MRVILEDLSHSDKSAIKHEETQYTVKMKQKTR